MKFVFIKVKKHREEVYKLFFTVIAALAVR